MRMRTYRDRQLGTLAALSAACVLAYGNSLHGGFLFDDNYAVLDNQDVTQPAISLATLLRNDFWGQPMASPSSHKSYRCGIPLIGCRHTSLG